MPPLIGYFLVDSLVVGVHHAVVAGGLIAALSAALGVSLLVQLLGNLVEGLLDLQWQP